ncbi:MAG: hypothetical protein AAFX93_11060 [Verrucomicrobiota bacterium]
MTDTNAEHSMRPAAWYFRCALWANSDLSERRRILLMLTEEIMLLEQQISYLDLTLPEWESPVLDSSDSNENLHNGLRLCNRMEALKEFIRENRPNDWPWRAYNAQSVFAQEDRPQQMIFQGDDFASLTGHDQFQGDKTIVSFEDSGS